MSQKVVAHRRKSWQKLKLFEKKPEECRKCQKNNLEKREFRQKQCKNNRTKNALRQMTRLFVKFHERECRFEFMKICYSVAL